MSYAPQHNASSPIDAIAPQVADLILRMLQLSEGASPSIQNYYKKMIKYLIRHMEYFVQPRVSVAAARKAAEMGIGDLHTMAWKHQPGKMKDKDRSIFHLEHVYQVADIARAMASIIEPTAQDVEALLRKSMTAWILKEENSRLKRGRRKDPLKAYADAGIQLISLPRTAPTNGDDASLIERAAL